MKLGTKHSEKTKRKMSKILKERWNDSEQRKKWERVNIGRKLTEEHKRKISQGLRGRKHSDETKLRISAALKGKAKSEEHREKMIKRMTGEKNPNFGKERSEETRRKISESNRGRVFTKEHRENISKALKGKKPPNTGILHSEKTRKKISIAMQGITEEEWDGFVSYEPYCDRFNEKLKENVRNRYNRVCVICGKSEILNGRRLSVHHIDGDKMQGCEGKGWLLVPLCIVHNSEIDTLEKEFLIITNS